MSSVRKRGNECFTRTAKSGATYVVCNDPPKGSRGQVGVYQAENPTGKQDGRTKRKEAEIDKQRAFNRVRKSMMNKTYQKNFGGEASTVDQRTPKSAPATSSMKKDLIDKGTDPKFLDGMGKLYIYTRWANETKQGKSFLKKEKLEKPTKFVDVDDKKYIEEAAGDILDGEAGGAGDAVEFKENRQDGYAFENGRLSGDERHRMIERTTRYKHYLELAGKTVPDWVKDIAD